MRRSVWFVVTAVLTAGLQVGPAVAAHADVAAPVLAPADGAQLTSTDAVFSATYDVVAGELSGIVVTDSNSGARVPCADRVRFAVGSHVVRCAVRDLAPGAELTATATLRDIHNQVVRTDSWTVVVATPVLASTSPASGQLVAGTVDDPAPGPGHAVTASFDRPLDPNTSTGRLFAVASGVRTAVVAAVAVTGSTITVEPAEDLPTGEYALVARAVSDDAGQASTPVTVEFGVGDTGALPSAPVPAVPTASQLADSMAVTLSAPLDAIVGLVVYDPAHPQTVNRSETLVRTACVIAGQTFCLRGSLPVSGLDAGSYAWYADVRSGSSTRSTPDHSLQLLSPVVPDAPTGVFASGPMSDIDPPYMHVNAHVGPDVVAAYVTAAADGVNASRSVAVARAAQQVEANLSMLGFADGPFTITVTPVNAAGVAGTPATATATKESVPMAVQPPTGRLVGAIGPMTVFVSEDFLPASTVVVKDAAGHAVAGLVGRDHVSHELRFRPDFPLTTQTYSVHAVVYAATCTSTDLATCEQVDTTFAQPVDATPDPATAITVTPRLPDPGMNTVVVAGHGTPGDAVEVDVGSSGTIGWGGRIDADAITGEGTFTSGPIDLSSLPHTVQHVTVTTTDNVDNQGVTGAGVVDRRYPTGVTAGVDRASTPWGTTVVVSGRLTVPARGHGLAGRIAIIERRDDGTSVTLARTRSSVTGLFSRAVVLTRTGALRVRYVGGTTTRPGLSGLTRRVTVGAAAAPADHPDTLAAAREAAASSQGRRLAETLRSSNDVDVYTFGVATAGRHLIRLGHLPADYTLAVYNRAGRLLAASRRSNTQYEEIYHYLPAGTFFVRVSSAHGSSATQPYHLSFRRLADTVTLISRHIDRNGSPSALVEVLNNTAQWRTTYVEVDCVRGGSVHPKATWIGVPVLPPHGRRPFEMPIVPTCAAGWSLRFSAAYPAATSWRPPAASYGMRHGAPYDTRSGRIYPFTVTNTGDRTLRHLTAGLCAYDDEGRLVAYSYYVVDPLKPGETQPRGFNELFRPYTHPNRVAFVNTFG